MTNNLAGLLTESAVRFPERPALRLDDTVVAGDSSLTAAILAGHWVASHERYGRKR